MDLISLKELSEEFNYTINTLRVYHSSRKIPMVKQFKRLYVTPETFKRLKYLHAMGAPFSQFYDKGEVSLPLERIERGAVLPSQNQSNTSALIAELQKTIADQERQIELSERRERKAATDLQALKENYDYLSYDCKKLNLENQMLRERLPVKETTDIERGVAALQDADAETLNKIVNEAAVFDLKLVKEAKKLLSKMETKQYNKEEDQRIAKLLDETLREQNKPR